MCIYLVDLRGVYEVKEIHPQKKLFKFFSFFKKIKPKNVIQGKG